MWDIKKIARRLTNDQKQQKLQLSSVGHLPMGKWVREED